MSPEKPFAATRTALQTSKSSKTRQNKLGVLTSTWISNKPLWSYTRKLLNLIEESFPNCSVTYCMYMATKDYGSFKVKKRKHYRECNNLSIFVQTLVFYFVLKGWCEQRSDSSYSFFFRRADLFFFFFVWTLLSELLHYYHFSFKYICCSSNRA